MSNIDLKKWPTIMKTILGDAYLKLCLTSLCALDNTCRLTHNTSTFWAFSEFLNFENPSSGSKVMIILLRFTILSQNENFCFKNDINRVNIITETWKGHSLECKNSHEIIPRPAFCYPHPCVQFSCSCCVYLLTSLEYAFGGDVKQSFKYAWPSYFSLLI